MNPIVDNRAALLGQPGLHVFLVGVSAYPNLPPPKIPGAPAPPPAPPQSYGMTQLSATARTAYQVYEWLKAHEANLPLPLATVWMLLSPSALELQEEPAMAGVAPRPDLANFMTAASGWQNAAAENPEGMALFYFAGHGVQRNKDDAVLILDEFGGVPPGLNPLSTSVDVRTLFLGMAPSMFFPNMARTQVYVIDACRNHPTQFNQFEQLKTSEFFSIPLNGRDDRIAPIFYAAVPDSKGYAIPGEHTVFSSQLLQCLEGAAGTPGAEDTAGNLIWEVTVHSLTQALTDRFSQLTPAEKADQDFTVGGQVKDALLFKMAGAPQAVLSLTCDPATYANRADLEIRDSRGNPVRIRSPFSPHPYQQQLSAGLYQFHTWFPSGAPLPDWSRLVQLKPTGGSWMRKV